MKDTMTLKEIAKLTGHGKATIQDWIKKMNENRLISNEIRSSSLSDGRIKYQLYWKRGILKELTNA